MGSSGSNAKQFSERRLKSEQAAASKLPLTDAQKDLMKEFSFKVPNSGLIGSVESKAQPKLLKFTKGDGTTQSSFEFEQDGAVFGAGTFASQEQLARQFDPTKAFQITGGKDTPTLVQGKLSFQIPNPIAIRKVDPTDPASISPNAAPNQPLPRVPRDIKGGSMIGTSASRTLSNSAIARGKRANLLTPVLAGY